MRRTTLVFVLLMPCAVVAQTTGVVQCTSCDAPSQVLHQASYPDPPQSAAPSNKPSANGPVDPNTNLSAGQWIRRFANDQWQIYSGPFRSKSAIKWDLLVAGATGGLIVADRHISNGLPRDHLYVSREISNIGAYTTVGTVGALWLTGEITDDPHAHEAGVLGIESLANGAAVWAVMNTLTRRERPLEGTGRGRFWVNNGLKSSMPSAHAVLTWAAATTIAQEYPSPLVDALAYGTATAVSITRATGLRHFPSDSFVGAAFGYFIAREMFRLHCEPGLSAACHKTHSSKHHWLWHKDSSTADAMAAEPAPALVSNRP